MTRHVARTRAALTTGAAILAHAVWTGLAAAQGLPPGPKSAVTTIDAIDADRARVDRTYRATLDDPRVVRDTPIDPLKGLRAAAAGDVTNAATVAATGIITTYAGTGTAGFLGDGAVATSARLSFMGGLAIDAAGNLYIADLNNDRIRKVTAATGIITTFAGGGACCALGDGGLATAARLNGPLDVAVDGAGNLYIADMNNQRIRKVTASTGIITTVAGSGTAGFAGDGGVATAAQLRYPHSVAVDAAGNLYIADTDNNRIRKVTAATGIITTLAGDGTYGFAGDGGAAFAAQLRNPTGVSMNGAGTVVIADNENNRIRAVNQVTGIITTIAGTGTAGYAGEAGAATSAQLYRPVDTTVDASGNLYIAEFYGERVRKVTAGDQLIFTVAGSGRSAFGGDGGAGPAAQLNTPNSVAVDASGNLYISDASNYRIRKLTPPTVPALFMTTKAGTPGTPGFAGDGAAALAARLHNPAGLAVDASGNLYIADLYNHRIRKVTAGTGTITTIAGGGCCTLGDGGAATAAELYYPFDVAVDSQGNVFIADSYHGRIRKVTAATGIITTVAGSGTYGYAGDGGVATAAQLNYPTGIAVDAAGNLYIADSENNRIRKVTAATSIITTIAGSGAYGFSGDGASATTAQMRRPIRVALDTAGNVFIADTNNVRVRKVTVATGVISTIAGTGSSGFTGEAGAATSARLDGPDGLAVDAAGNVYIADYYNHRIRKVTAATGRITTVAGNDYYGFGGDGGAGPAATLYYPEAIALTAGGSLYIADSSNDCIRLASVGCPAIALSPSSLAAAPAGAAYPATAVTQTGGIAPATFTITSGALPAGMSLATNGQLAGTPLAAGSYGFTITATDLNGCTGSRAYTLLISPTPSGRPPVADFNGDGRADYGVFRPSSGTWFVNGVSVPQLGATGDIPVIGDYDGDGRTDAALYRPSTGHWFVNGQAAVQWGRAGDVPVPADYNGDGRVDAAVFRTTDGPGAAWFVNGQFVLPFGLRGDIPMPADFDGDARADLAVFRPSTAQWFVLSSASGYAATSVIQWGLPGDVPLVGQLDTDNLADLAVFRPSSGLWFLRLTNAPAVSLTWGSTGDVPVLMDVTGDGIPELCVWRPSTGYWLAYDRTTGVTTAQAYGLPGDVAAMQRPQLPSAPATDFDGDGIADVTVYRGATGMWHTRRSSSGFALASSRQWGLAGDIRVPGDYDGDRRTDPAVYRPSTGQWFLMQSATDTPRVVSWGLPGDVAMPADYDGDGRTDAAVYRPSTGQWFVLTSGTGFGVATVTQWGLPSDTPLAADFDGDGRADFAVYRPSAGLWFLKLTTAAFGASIVRQWGLPTDVPRAADFDGDGRADLVVYRPSTGQWFVADPLTTLTSLSQWGLPGDVPVPQDFDGDGRADLAIYRASEGGWYLGLSTGGTLFLQWGLPTDIPLSVSSRAAAASPPF